MSEVEKSYKMKKAIVLYLGNPSVEATMALRQSTIMTLVSSRGGQKETTPDSARSLSISHVQSSIGLEGSVDQV